MAVNTTLRSPDFNRGLYSHTNLAFTSTTGIAPGGTLTVAGDTLYLVEHELPNLTFKCRCIGTNRGDDRRILKANNTVTG